MHGGLTTAEAFPAESAGGLEQPLARCAAINLPPREVNRSQHDLPLHAVKMTSKSVTGTNILRRPEPNRTELENQKLRIRSGGTATITFYRTD